jgi:uncharacterized protein with HEPN domain
LRDDKEKLDKVLECIDRITAYTKQGKDEYFANTMIQDAVVRNLQILGECFKDLSEELRQQNSDVEWKDAARFRDKVTHDYFDIDHTKVWSVVENKLGPLRLKILDIHRRLVYKVPGEHKRPGSLEQRLNNTEIPPDNT